MQRSEKDTVGDARTVPGQGSNWDSGAPQLIPGGVSGTLTDTPPGIYAGAPPEAGATADETEGLTPDDGNSRN